MIKRLLMVGFLLAGAVLAAPASASHEAPTPKPYRSETVTVQVGRHPMAVNTDSGNPGWLGITAREFTESVPCALPESNGLDAAVFKIPAAYRRIPSQITAVGKGTTDAAVPTDVDIYVFRLKTAGGNACGYYGRFTTPSSSPESGVVPTGTAFVMLHNVLGGPTDLHFTLRPYRT